MSTHTDFDLLLAYLHDGLSDEELVGLQERLRNEPELADELACMAVEEGIIAEWARGQSVSWIVSPRGKLLASRWRLTEWPPRLVLATGLAAGLLLAAGALTWFTPGRPGADAPAAGRSLPGGGIGVASTQPVATAPRVATLTARAGAEFSEPSTPPQVGDSLAEGEQYVLRSGRIEVRFTSGAVAVVEGPAIFRVGGRMLLEGDLGDYSVHVSEKARGFRLASPAGDVVDLGTRFATRVEEAGTTEVTVVDGRVEFVREGMATIQIAAGHAWRFGAGPQTAARAEEVEFDPASYMSELPDRVVAYTARGGGGAEELTSVTVQRGGQEFVYRVEDLIGVELIHFKGSLHARHHLMLAGEAAAGGGEPTPRGRRALLEGDARLNSGVINIGGSSNPPVADPVMGEGDDPAQPSTPGMAIRFTRPIVNAAGPDVILFELQGSTHNPRGDFFRVIPLRFAAGLRAHTVEEYDIDLRSAEALPAGPVQLRQSETSPQTLDQLLSGPTQPLGHSGGFKVLAVGIDLAWLGYPEGAAVEGLLIQDTLDDEELVDPTFVGGLPNVE